MAGAGKITLRVYRTEDVVCISIKDNGKGIKRERVEQVLNGTYRADGKTASNGIGMDNVIARLRLFTGSDDVIAISSEGENQGTEIILYLQIREGEDV